jgi:hypothetical protein
LAELLKDRTVPSTFTVLNLADSGTGSLRQAVLDANANPGADLILFAPSARDGTPGGVASADFMTVILANDASTSDDDVFGVLTLI